MPMLQEVDISVMGFIPLQGLGSVSGRIPSQQNTDERILCFFTSLNVQLCEFLAVGYLNFCVQSS